MNDDRTISGTACVRALRKVGFRVKLVSERRTIIVRGGEELAIPRSPKLTESTVSLILLGACLSRETFERLLDPPMLVNAGQPPTRANSKSPL